MNLFIEIYIVCAVLTLAFLLMAMISADKNKSPHLDNLRKHKNGALIFAIFICILWPLTWMELFRMRREKG